MSNYPHSASIASSLSASPYAVQSNLESLIARSRAHPNPRRFSQGGAGDDEDGESQYHGHRHHHRESADSTLGHGHNHTRRPSEFARHAGHPIHPIREVSGVGADLHATYDDGPAIMLQDDDDADDDADATERTGLIGGSNGRRGSRRGSRVSTKSKKSSYGSTAAIEPITRLTRARRASQDQGGSSGNSRSRSKARSPPRAGGKKTHRDGREVGPDEVPSSTDDDGNDSSRGRETDSRPLSRSSSPVIRTHKAESIHSHYSRQGHTHGGKRRRSSVATATARMAGDSSGDEGGDVTRGLVQTGGGGVFGGRAGLGMTPAAGGVGSNGLMDADPAEELGAAELELPLTEAGKEVRQWSEALRAETAIILRSSLPVFFTQIAEWSLVLASVVSIGHLGTEELAASSLASMTASVSSFSILQGLATALDTLLPAAWTSSDPTRVGLWAQRTSVVMAVSTIPMFVLWWNIEGILLALGQEAAVASLAARYLRYLSFSIPGYGGNVVIKKYLQAQNLMHVPTYVLFIVAPANLVFNYLLVWGPDAIRLGFVGGACATAISYTLLLLLNLGWALFFGPREAFHPVKAKHLFSKLGTVTSLGLAGTIMLSSEWWAWEACALAASLLGPTTLAAQSVVLSTASTFFQVPAAIGVASAVRVGNLLGAGRGWEAKWASRACLFIASAMAVVNSLICIIFRKNWGYLFNNDPDVVEIVASIMPYIGLFQITDGVAAVAGSVLRALGLHTTGALINLTSYYIIGLPFGLWLCFSPKFGMGLVGLWIGLSVALGYGSVVSFVLVWRADWPRAVERVRERLGLPSGEVDVNGKFQEMIREESEEDDEFEYRD